jgi:radical SAM superfamily enzyme YgiQ (UPF0313 family)
MKILLVNAIDIGGKNKPYEEASEGLAIPYIASYIQQHMDSAIIAFVDRNFEEELDRLEPDIVGISFVTINYHIAARYAEIAKTRGVRVVGGGHHISAAPMTLPYGMDVGVIGEGEETFLDLLKNYAPEYPGNHIPVERWHSGFNRRTSADQGHRFASFPKPRHAFPPRQGSGDIPRVPV